MFNAWKYVSQIVLPGFGLLYFVGDLAWGLPNATLVLAVIVGVVFVSSLVFLYLTDRLEPDGVMEVVTDEDGCKTFTLALNDDPEGFEHKPFIVFRVTTSSSEE